MSILSSCQLYLISLMIQICSFVLNLFDIAWSIPLHNTVAYFGLLLESFVWRSFCSTVTLSGVLIILNEVPNLTPLKSAMQRCSFRLIVPADVWKGIETLPSWVIHWVFYSGWCGNMVIWKYSNIGNILVLYQWDLATLGFDW